MPTYLEIAAQKSVLFNSFLKARTWLWEQPYYDTVEIKLFEWHLDRNLEDLSLRLADDYRFTPLFGYLLPKDATASRKFAYRSFMDEVATVAVCSAVGYTMEKEMDRGGIVSFGNRLDLTQNSDRLYIPWFRSWDRFSSACRRTGQYAPFFVRTDVKNFYPEIPRDRLAAHLAQVLPRDPVHTFLQRLIHEPDPHGDGRRGIPVGPAVSGFLANLYLLPLDRTIKWKWHAADRFRRYVDDIFYFTRSRDAAVRANRALVHTVGHDFGLRLHTGKKLEIGWSRDPLHRGSPPREWQYTEALFDTVYGSLYRLDRPLWGLFRREPGKFLRWYSRGLRWLGIYVSTDWLAQRLLTVQARGAGSRWLPQRGSYRLRYPSLALEGVEQRGMRGWAMEFARLNPHFMRDLSRLHGLMKRLTGQAYDNLGDVRRQPKKQLKGRIFTLRNFAGRLALMRCDRFEHVFNMLVDHAWILDPALSINAFLSMPHAYEKLVGILRSRRPAIVRARAAWALGELGEARAVRVLWDEGKWCADEVVRRCAYEALLRIDVWKDLPVAWVLGEIAHEPSPALRKFHYLMLGRIRPEGVEKVLQQAFQEETDPTCRLAVEYAFAESESVYHVAGEVSMSAEPLTSILPGHPAERR